MQRILNIITLMKPELFLMRLMNTQLEKTYGRLILFMVTPSKSQW